MGRDGAGQGSRSETALEAVFAERPQSSVSREHDERSETEGIRSANRVDDLGAAG